MERPFPIRAQQLDQGCMYLPTDEIHERLVEELKNAIMVTDIRHQSQGRGTIDQVQVFLAATFGGIPGHYPYKRIAGAAYIVMLPATLDQSQVVNAGDIWGVRTKWQFDFWDSEGVSYGIKNQFRVKIKITNFPFTFWHQKYIKHVVSEFGEVVQIDNENLDGDNWSCIRLWLECSDPKRIPLSSVLPRSTRWSECYIQIEDWKFIGWVPPFFRLMAPDEDDAPYVHQGSSMDARQTLLLAQDHFKQLQDDARTLSSSGSSGTDMVSPPEYDHGTTIGPQEPGLGSPAQVYTRVQSNQVGMLYWKKLYGRKDGNGTCVALQSENKKAGIKVGEILVLNGDWLSQTASWPTEKTKLPACQTGIPACSTPKKPHINPTFSTPDQFIVGQFLFKPMQRWFVSNYEVQSKQDIYGPSLQYPPTKPKTENLHYQLSLPLSQNPNCQLTTMDLGDEEFVARFAALNSGTSESQPIQLFQHEISTRDWSACALARVVTDKTMNSSQFSSIMMKAWGADPETTVTILTRDIFLVQFVNSDELQRIVNCGIWTYRGDAVVMRAARSETDIAVPRVTHMEVWSQ